MILLKDLGLCFATETLSLSLPVRMDTTQLRSDAIGNDDRYSAGLFL